MKIATLTAVLLLTFAMPVVAAELPTAKPADVGLSGERLARIGQAIDREIEANRMPGAVVLIARKGRVAYLETFGYRDKSAGARMTPDAIFRTYSMTKPITSVAIMMLIEEGRLTLDTPVSRVLPQLGKLSVATERLDPATGRVVVHTVPTEREITIQDLLRHTSGFTYGSRSTKTSVRDAYAKAEVDANDLTNAELIDRLAKVPLVHQPGTRFEYGRSTDVLGRVVEVVAGTTLGRFFDERIHRPLDMRDSGFWVPADKHARIAEPLPKDVISGQDVRLLPITEPRKYESGGGGGVSTARDYARFAHLLLRGGELDGVRLLSRRTVELMTSDHLGAIRSTFSQPGHGFGLGFAVRTETGVSPFAGSVGDYNWAGAGGTYFWVDPKEQLVAILMAQTPGAIRTYYRGWFRNLVYQALTD